MKYTIMFGFIKDGVELTRELTQDTTTWDRGEMEALMGMAAALDMNWTTARGNGERVDSTMDLRSVDEAFDFAWGMFLYIYEIYDSNDGIWYPDFDTKNFEYLLANKDKYPPHPYREIV